MVNGGGNRGGDGGGNSGEVWYFDLVLHSPDPPHNTFILTLSPVL